MTSANPLSPCDCADGACACYVEGYSDGRDKAHFEVRNILGASHAADCACEPCKSARANFQAGYEAGRTAAYDEVLELLGRHRARLPERD